MRIKGRYISGFLLITIVFVFFVTTSIDKTEKTKPMENFLSGNVCEAMKVIYQNSLSVDNQSEYCQTNSGEQYLRIKRYGIEGGSGIDFFDLQGKKIGAISQYGYGDGTIPKKAAISGITFNDGSCEKTHIQQCGIIDLFNSYRGTEGLLKDSEYAKTCKNTIKKLGLNPYNQSTQGNSVWRDRSHRTFMCTDDKAIFYIGFTGNKIGNEKSATYKNYDSIEYFSIKGKFLGITTGFILKTNGDQLYEINITDKNSPYSINRCIYMPIHDCYE